MESIPLPTTVKVAESKKDWARIIIEPCYPGYGTTIGNTLRRVLLSSMAGSAITAVKIEGVEHEFSTIANVKEDAVAIILNLKLIRFKVHSDEPVQLMLNVKGERTVTAADFEGPSSVEIINEKQPVASLTDKSAELKMTIAVASGRGYVPVENREKEKLDVGWIAIDSIFTPMKTVNFTVENVRVGQITNYDRLILDVETDGSIKPEEAVAQSAKILVDHFSILLQLSGGAAEAPKKKRTRSKKPESVASVEDQVDSKPIAEERKDDAAS